MDFTWKTKVPIFERDEEMSECNVFANGKILEHGATKYLGSMPISMEDTIDFEIPS